MNTNKIMVAAGIITFVQAVYQLILSALALAQYFCLIDFLRGYALLLFVKILYFNNPARCEANINIGQIIAGIPNQAYVYTAEEPVTTTRNFYITCAHVACSALWIICSGLIMSGGAGTSSRKLRRYPWITLTVITTVMDIVSVVIYINDSIYTRTLTDMMRYMGGRVVGVGNIEIDTHLAAWFMVMLYCRFGVFIVVNILLLILVMTARHEITNVNTTVETPPAGLEESATSEHDIIECDVTDDRAPIHIPRAVICSPQNQNKARHKRKRRLIRARNISEETADAILAVSMYRIVSPLHSPVMPKPVYFEETQLSLPKHVEMVIVKQRYWLNKLAYGDSYTMSLIELPDRKKRSPTPPEAPAPHPKELPAEHDNRRGTADELKGQLPWTYIPASSHRMRDQLPPDEDLPPVPLPDYTAIPSFRRHSVHRAASSSSALENKGTRKEVWRRRAATISRLYKHSNTQPDVLY